MLSRQLLCLRWGLNYAPALPAQIGGRRAWSVYMSVSVPEIVCVGTSIGVRVCTSSKTPAMTTCDSNGVASVSLTAKYTNT